MANCNFSFMMFWVEVVEVGKSGFRWQQGGLKSQLFKLLKPNDIYIYMSYRSANLQTLHFKYLFNKYTY